LEEKVDKRISEETVQNLQKEVDKPQEKSLKPTLSLVLMPA